VLGLGSDARMNRPGVAGGNWSWRLERGQLTPALAARLRAATERGRR
jgi:4-alpha-glucanotransferase